jgi:hypothetical protein
MIMDSLSNKIYDGDKEKARAKTYIHNIRYYESIMKYPYFSDNFFVRSFLESKLGEEEKKDMMKRFSGISNERVSIKSDPRLELDPITITPIESLSHAYYHRAYEKYYSINIQDSLIPFPNPYTQRTFMNRIFPKNNSFTYGTASFNAESLSLRVCPLPVSSLRRFIEIDLEEYSRNCNSDCQLPVKDMKESADDTPKVCNDKGTTGDDTPKVCNDKGTAGDDSPKCNATSMGLIQSIFDVINGENSLKNKRWPILNIWRSFTLTSRSEDKYEKGSVKLLAQANTLNFQEYPDQFGTQIMSKLKERIYDNFPHQHLRVNILKTRRLFAGRVFVSLPFEHPMHEKWLNYIKEAGEKNGFSEVDTTKTFTQPVTNEVGSSLKRSHAMIQILSFPKSNESQCGLEWLYAEYLTAITNGLKVVRIIDTSTINIDKIRIGRDHMSFRFSRFTPFDDFMKVVDEAFENLKKELTNSFKLGNKVHSNVK